MVEIWVRVLRYTPKPGIDVYPLKVRFFSTLLQGSSFFNNYTLDYEKRFTCKQNAMSLVTQLDSQITPLRAAPCTLSHGPLYQLRAWKSLFAITGFSLTQTKCHLQIGSIDQCLVVPTSVWCLPLYCCNCCSKGLPEVLFQFLYKRGLVDSPLYRLEPAIPGTGEL